MAACINKATLNSNQLDFALTELWKQKKNKTMTAKGMLSNQIFNKYRVRLTVTCSQTNCKPNL